MATRRPAGASAWPGGAPISRMYCVPRTGSRPWWSATASEHGWPCNLRSAIRTSCVWPRVDRPGLASGVARARGVHRARRAAVCHGRGAHSRLQCPGSAPSQPGAAGPALTGPRGARSSGLAAGRAGLHSALQLDAGRSAARAADSRMAARPPGTCPADRAALAGTGQCAGPIGPDGRYCVPQRYPLGEAAAQRGGGVRPRGGAWRG